MKKYEIEIAAGLFLAMILNLAWSLFLAYQYRNLLWILPGLAGMVLFMVIAFRADAYQHYSCVFFLHRWESCRCRNCPETRHVWSEDLAEDFTRLDEGDIIRRRARDVLPGGTYRIAKRHCRRCQEVSYVVWLQESVVIEASCSACGGRGDVSGPDSLGPEPCGACGGIGKGSSYSEMTANRIVPITSTVWGRLTGRKLYLYQ